PNGAVLLVRGVATTACDAATVMDRVALGTSDCGATTLPSTTAASAWTRDVFGCSAIGTLTNDFIRATPTPRTSASSAVTCACTDELAVNDTTDPELTNLEVDFCNIQFPPSVAVSPGASSATIYGRVFHNGLTTLGGQATGIRAQLGFGPVGSDPAAQRHWAFFEGAFNAEVGNDDEYQSTLPAALLSEGNRSYAYTWRMSRDGGASWTFCDKDGAGRNPNLDFSPSELGLMVVGAQCTRDTECQSGGTCNMTNYQCEYPPLTIGYCRLHFPATATVDVGGAVDLYGRAYIATLTDRTPNANDPDTLGRVIAQAGYGPVGAAPASFTWGPAGIPTPNYVGPGGGDTNNDEYRATFSPNVAGTFDMAMRFSGDGGTTWLYCDKDGSVTNADYSASQAGTLTVTGGAQPVTLLSQNFDGLPNTGTSIAKPTFLEALPGWALTTGVSNLRTGTGSDNAGSIYSFGAAASTERALGGIGSSSTGTQNWGFCYTNTQATALTNLKLDYVGEQWRVGQLNANQLDVSYSLEATVSADLASTVDDDAGWTRVNALDFVSPTLSSTAGALDGNNTNNRTARSHTFAETLPVGGTLCVRWRDIDNSGADHGLAIDDLVLTGVPQ
ncbi:MAG TPA: hypothetical protein PK095_16300, partial [Myxococcota bacterium]|nr:hypothetical protein [Myxococcota bacterium]